MSSESKLVSMFADEGVLCGDDGCEVVENGASVESPRTILPGATIGVLGGGQLGRMLAHAGNRLGYRFVTLDPTPDSPCGQTAAQIVASYDDQEAARELARRSDVITYEFENVDASVAAMLETESYVPQGSVLLYTTQHRIREKRAVEAAGARVAPYAEVESLESLRKAAASLGLPAVLKTATGGYDGKGQWVLRTDNE
jgi:5-(carboxyamino)imidazole ribonucleotide synthase